MSVPALEPGDGVPQPLTGDSSSDPGAPLQACNELPWVDPAVFDGLEQQMGSRKIALDFARDYANLWVRRQQNLRAAMERQDKHAALDAALSLKNASAMVGAIRLAHLAEAMVTAIRTCADLDGGMELLDLVADHGHATVRELQDTYLGAGEALRTDPEG